MIHSFVKVAALFCPTGKAILDRVPCKDKSMVAILSELQKNLEKTLAWHYDQALPFKENPLERVNTRARLSP